MRRTYATILLIAALVLPIALFLLLRQHFHLNGLIAAAIAVTAGWALNIVWAFVSQGGASIDPSPAKRGPLSIAGYFGWVCPTVLVLLASLAWRFVA